VESRKESTLRKLEYVLTFTTEAMPEEKTENHRIQKITPKMRKEYPAKEFPER